MAGQIDCPAPLLEGPADALLMEMLTPAPYKVPEKTKKAKGTRKSSRCQGLSDLSSNNSAVHSSHEDEEEDEDDEDDDEDDEDIAEPDLPSDLSDDEDDAELDDLDAFVDQLASQDAKKRKVNFEDKEPVESGKKRRVLPVASGPAVGDGEQTLRSGTSPP